MDPSLDRIAVRQCLGGHLTNTPDNIVKWLPQARCWALRVWASPLHAADPASRQTTDALTHDDPEPEPPSNPH